uniref:BED-type domain-containing protein n=1 Tax=Plectus sambesii TaxID=2011161 RepID=A0A914WPU0_9BILA
MPKLSTEQRIRVAMWDDVSKNGHEVQRKFREFFAADEALAAVTISHWYNVLLETGSVLSIKREFLKPAQTEENMVAVLGLLAAEPETCTRQAANSFQKVIHEISAINKQHRAERCQGLLQRIWNRGKRRIVFMDEKKFTLGAPWNAQNEMVSAVWEYFDIGFDPGLKCKLCRKALKRTDTRTKSLWSHLRYKHPLQFKKVSQDKIWSFMNDYADDSFLRIDTSKTVGMEEDGLLIAGCRSAQTIGFSPLLLR